MIRRGARAFVRAARRALGFGPFVGIAWVLALVSWAGSRASSDDADLGDARRAEAMAEFIAARFGPELTRIKLRIALAAVALGVVVGLAADLLAAARRSPRRGRGAPAYEKLALVASIHAAVVAWSMAESPQLYSGRWYAVGGVRRAAQVLLTDVVGPSGVVVLAAAFAVAYLRPAGTRRLVGRLISPLSRAARPSALAAVAFLSAGLAIGPEPAPRASAPSSGEAAPPPRAPGRPPSVLLVAVDSLRADRVDAVRAPTLAALAARAVSFERAYVSVPRTFPSWVTLLTGRHPHHHGVRSMFPTWEDRARDFDALPARLRQAGYETAVVSDYAGDIFTRIELGFGLVDTPTFDFRVMLRQRALERETPLLPVLHTRLGRAAFPEMRELPDGADPEMLVDDAARALGRASSSGRPFFLTVFFSTAHFPYAAPAPFYAKYTESGYRGRFKYKKPVGLGGEAEPDAEDVAQIRALYDGAVTAIDRAIARLLGELRARGLADDTIVVLTADHGETLYDHGHGQGHGDHLFGDEGSHVPLVVLDPRVRRPGRVTTVTRDVDLAPTLYELTGVTPPRDLDGESLAPALRGEALAPRTAFAETELWFTEEIPGLPASLRMPYPGIMRLTEIDSRHGAEVVLRKDMRLLTTVARHRMIREEQYKLVYVPTRDGPKLLLFDTVADPAETIDVAAARPAIVERLRRALFDWMLEDHEMVERGGLVVPREPAAGRTP